MFVGGILCYVTAAFSLLRSSGSSLYSRYPQALSERLALSFSVRLLGFWFWVFATCTIRSVSDLVRGYLSSKIMLQ